MFTTRWQPWVDLQSDVNRMRDEMDRVFGRYTGRRSPLAPAAYPLLNMWEDGDRVYVEAELPGMDMNDLEIFVHGNQLSIKGQRKPPENQEATWHRQERGFGTFSRIVVLGVDVQPESVEAELKDGVLTVTLPKREEAKPRRIEVRVQ
jgi:HSP20 family protein